MTREDELRKIIANAEAELAGIPAVDRMGLREFAREAGFSPTTATRIKQGHPGTTLGSLKKALPFLGECPCCGSGYQQWLGRDKPGGSER